jgi:tetratricopeptide (TPR) repeat protein
MKYLPAAACLVVWSAALAGGKLESDDLPGPQPEAIKDPAPVEVPPVPAFDLPAVEPGLHTPRELHVHGKRVLGTEVKVKGYITWVYDCTAVLLASNPHATRAQIQVAIAKDPSLCERPKFYLGDSKTAPRDSSIWVVDVPQPPTKADRDRMSRDELKASQQAPKLVVGDYVLVTGTWAIQSPHAEHNTDGLLVYKSLEHPPVLAAPSPAGAPDSAPAEPDVAVVTKVPQRKHVDDKLRNSSIDHLNACNKANAARQFDAAIAECQTATKIWDGNHLAWYAWASAHMARGEWQQARTAIEHAVTLRPDQGMYQLYHGISLYEAEVQQARDDLARKENRKPSEVVINTAALKLEPARDALRRAVKLVPSLWRAHYYLARVYRDLDDSRRAAEQFSATIKTHPAYRFGYIALIELYRRWDYLDQALAVATLGTANVPATEAGELWYELGMVYDAKHVDDKAIDAFSKAIAAKPDDLSSKFQRGQVYFRKSDYANARRDLEEVAASGDPRVATTRPIAKQLLAQIAAKQR